MLAGLFGPSEGVTSREWWRFPSPITVLPRDGRGPDCSPRRGSFMGHRQKARRVTGSSLGCSQRGRLRNGRRRITLVQPKQKHEQHIGGCEQQRRSGESQPSSINSPANCAPKAHHIDRRHKPTGRKKAWVSFHEWKHTAKRAPTETDAPQKCSSIRCSVFGDHLRFCHHVQCFAIGKLNSASALCGLIVTI